MAEGKEMVWAWYFDHWHGTNMGAARSMEGAYKGVASVLAPHYEADVASEGTKFEIRQALEAGRWEEAAGLYYGAVSGEDGDEGESHIVMLLMEVPLAG